MSYNRNNILQRMVDIQKITLEHKEKGVTQKHVYETIIFPTYKISFRTFNEYLGFNAKAELTKMRQQRAMQPTLF